MRLVKIRHRGEVCAFTVRIYFLAAYVTETEKNRFPSESGFFILSKLLNFNSCACSLKSCLESFGFFLGSTGLNSLGSTLNEFLSFLKTETCSLTNCLDNIELLSAEVLEDNVKLCLFFSCGSCCAANCNCCNRSSGYAEFLFESLYKVSYFEDSKCLDFINDCCNLFRCHDNFLRNLNEFFKEFCAPSGAVMG